MIHVMVFCVLQGDNGEKGPEGAPGKDGSRVSIAEAEKIATLFCGNSDPKSQWKYNDPMTK